LRISGVVVLGIYRNLAEGALLVKIHAAAHWLLQHHVPLLPRLLTLFNRVVFAVQLPAETKLGRGVRLNYSGLGTVLHARAVIGDRVEIGPGVVIGGRSEIWEVPVIEADVYIGVGAKVLGPVRVGRGAVIGANAVVLHDVPPGAVVGGIPARILRRRDVARDDPAAIETEIGNTGT
jgi:serine O-acetyltransferase